MPNNENFCALMVDDSPMSSSWMRAAKMMPTVPVFTMTTRSTSNVSSFHSIAPPVSMNAVTPAPATMPSAMTNASTYPTICQGLLRMAANINDQRNRTIVAITLGRLPAESPFAWTCGMFFRSPIGGVCVALMPDHRSDGHHVARRRPRQPHAHLH